MTIIPETRRGKSEKSKRGKSDDVLENPIAYTIEDRKFGKFDVLNSANAWWLERAKVELLIAACKIDASVEECCSWAGISEDQYKYFREQHHWFSPLKTLCNEMPSIKARNTVVAGLEDVNNARWYLEKKRKKEFGNDTPTLNIDISISSLISQLNGNANRRDERIIKESDMAALAPLPDSR